MAPRLMVLIAAGPTNPSKATAVAALQPGQAMNKAITTVIVTTNAKPMTTVSESVTTWAGPRSLSSRVRPPTPEVSVLGVST